MPKKKHIHRFFRVKGKYTYIFKCAFPDCVFSLNPGQFELLLGRESLCNECDNKLIMTEDSLEENYPKCIKCKFKYISIINKDSNNNPTSKSEEMSITDTLDGFLEMKGIE